MGDYEAVYALTAGEELIEGLELTNNINIIEEEEEEEDVDRSETLIAMENVRIISNHFSYTQ